jgi:hypothetical protein
MSDFLVEYMDGADVVRFRNTNPLDGASPILSAVVNRNGTLVPGIYDVTVSARSGSAGNITISVVDIGADNSQHGLVRACVFDGTTVHGDAAGNEVVRGLDVVLSASAANGHTARLYAGDWVGVLTAGNPDGTLLDESDGYRTPGVTTGHGAASSVAEAIFRVTNISGKTAFGCYLEIHPGFAMKRTSGAGLFFFDVTGDPTPKLSSGIVAPYLVTFGSPSGGKIPVKFDGAGVSVTHLGTGAVSNSFTDGLLRDGTTTYLVNAPSALAGSVIGAESTAASSDTADVRIYPTDFIQITTSDGVAYLNRPTDEGSAQWGQTPVGLTPSGGTTRRMANGDIAYFGRAFVIPAGATPQVPFLCNIRVIANVSTPNGA